jgi:DNA-binding LytR/AlgR family response regulator
LYGTPNKEETKDSKNNLEPITWFDGLYYKNQIPNTILFNKKPLLSSVSKELILKKGQRYIELELNQLLRIESSAQGSTIFLQKEAFWTTDKTIEQFESDLEHSFFFRVNNHNLINLHHLTSFISCDAIVTLSNKEAIPVDSKSKDKLFKFLDRKQLI